MVNTVVVGAGHAGLAMSYCLKSQGIDHLVLERGEVGQRWRTERWDSITLLTPNWATQLPGYPYDGNDPDGFDSRDAYTAYLERYARWCDAPVQTHTSVIRVSAGVQGGFTVETSRGTIEARNVVAATGPFHEPSIPEASASLPDGIVQLHSSEYRQAHQLPEGPVLVVGSGNSGLQIVVDLLADRRKVFVSLGRVRSIPRRYRGRDAVRWLVEMGALDTLARHADPETRKTPPPLLSGVAGGRDLNLRQMAAQGATFAGRFLGVRGNQVLFSDDLLAILRASSEAYRGFRQRADRFIEARGLDAPVDATPCTDADLIPDVATGPAELDLGASGVRSVVWATGFRVAYNWIDVPVLDGSGQPMHQGGISPHPGFYFLGLRWLSKYKSFFIYGVGEDAQRLAAHIATPY